VTELFVRYLGEKTFEDLEIPLTLTAVDLNSNQEIRISDGLITDALRATISIPGIFVPVEKDDMRLVDGGLLNNLPVDIVRDMGADIILAVDVGWRGIRQEQIGESNQKTISRVSLVDLALIMYKLNHNSIADLVNEHRQYESIYQELGFRKVATWAYCEKTI